MHMHSDNRAAQQPIVTTIDPRLLRSAEEKANDFVAFIAAAAAAGGAARAMALIK